MSAEPTLRLLFPIELGGEHAADIAIDAAHLDAAQQSGEALLTEMRPDQTARLLTDWERVLGIVPGSDEPLQFRREQVVRTIRGRGGLSRGYFIGLAATLGYTIEIVEPVPFMVGWGRIGDRLNGSVVCHQWGVRISGQPVYRFRVGVSAMGERLLWWQSQTLLEDIIRELKPAHTFVYFIYE
jgi:uncharacterized protein YmfQ (DUF2313 family)